MKELIKEKSISLGKTDKNIQVSYLWHPSSGQGGRTLLILPGLDESITDYLDFLLELTTQFPQYSVLAIDLRGQGKTLENEGKIFSYTIPIENQISIIREFLNTLPIESLFVIGLSYGAGVALCAANRLVKVNGLALLAPYVSKFKNFNYGFTGLWYTLLHLNPFYKIMSHFSLPFYFQMARDRKKLNPNVQWTGKKLRALTKLSTGIMNISTTREAHNLKELPQGVHILLGENDDLVTRGAVEHLYQEISSQNKTMRILPRLGHRLLINDYSICSKWLLEILNERT